MERSVSTVGTLPGCNSSSEDEDPFEGSSGRIEFCSTTYFGTPLPTHILDSLCVRFILNLPQCVQYDYKRVLFELELAHWYYVDITRESLSNLPHLTFFQFCGQMLTHAQLFLEDLGSLRQMIRKWRMYKSGVPTYGAILLDSSLDYVLMVQGFYAKNSWGFPKGKRNESETGEKCAEREVLEETGYNIRGKIKSDLCVAVARQRVYCCLYVVTDVPMDYDFKPTARHEIRMIKWFNLWSIPSTRQNEETGNSNSSKSFATVLPFIDRLHALVKQLKQEKLAAQHEQEKATCTTRTKIRPKFKGTKYLPLLDNVDIKDELVNNCFLKYVEPVYGGSFYESNESCSYSQINYPVFVAARKKSAQRSMLGMTRISPLSQRLEHLKLSDVVNVMARQEYVEEEEDSAENYSDLLSSEKINEEFLLDGKDSSMTPEFSLVEEMLGRRYNELLKSNESKNADRLIIGQNMGNVFGGSGVAGDTFSGSFESVEVQEDLQIPLCEAWKNFEFTYEFKLFEGVNSAFESRS